MRFLPPVAALADGPVALRRRPARPPAPDGPACSTRCAPSGVDDRRRRPRRAPVHRPRHGRGAAAARSPSTRRRRRSSSPALLLAGARVRRGRDGAPRRASRCRRLPHIEMTVAMLRDAGVVVDDADADHAGGSRPARSAPSTCQSSPTCPTPRRSSPRAVVTGGTVTRARLAGAAPPRPATRCATILDRDGRRRRARRATG